MVRDLLFGHPLRQTGDETEMTREPLKQHLSEETESAPKAILDYLEKQPHPVTLEQIAEWRISQQSPRIDRAVVAKAIERLVEDGLLEVFERGSGRRYRLKETTEETAE